MHHQTDSLHDSDYFQIFPTVIGAFKLNGYHPAEERKAKELINKELVESKNFLDDNRLFMLKSHINDCIKAYSNEYGVVYYEINESWYQKVKTGEELAPQSFADEQYIGYYFPNADEQGSSLILDAPFKAHHQIPKDQSVSVYTAKDEKIVIDASRLILTPGHLTRYFTKNEREDMDMIVFNVKPC